MDIHNAWEKALENTQIVRGRARELNTFSETRIPYIFLAEALVNSGDTIVRKGEVVAKKPTIILPADMPYLEGFDFEKEYELGHEMVMNFLLVRGVSFPSMKYNNRVSSLDVHEGHLDKTINYYKDNLQRKEDVHSGLIIGPEDCWQLSVLIFLCMQIARSANSDIRRLLERFGKNKRRRK